MDCDALQKEMQFKCCDTQNAIELIGLHLERAAGLLCIHLQRVGSDCNVADKST